MVRPTRWQLMCTGTPHGGVRHAGGEEQLQQMLDMPCLRCGDVQEVDGA